MRKITITYDIKYLFSKIIKPLFKDINKIEMLHLLKLDFEKIVEITISKLTLKKGIKLENIKLPKYCEILDVLSNKDNQYICVIKAEAPKYTYKLAKLFDIDIIWDKPTYFTEHSCKVSCIGDEKKFEKIKKAISKVGKIKSISYSNSDYREENLLSNLTEKQKKVIFIAKKLGYYENPRKTTCEFIAKELKLTKSTVNEHLRKAETHIMNAILDNHT